MGHTHLSWIMMEEQHLMTQVGTIKKDLYDFYTNIRLSACLRKSQVDWNKLFTCFILFFNETNFIVKPNYTKRKLPKISPWYFWNAQLWQIRNFEIIYILLTRFNLTWSSALSLMNIFKSIDGMFLNGTVELNRHYWNDGLTRLKFLFLVFHCLFILCASSVQARVGFQVLSLFTNLYCY